MYTFGLGVIAIIFTILLFEKKFGRSLLTVLTFSLMLVCINYNGQMKTEFLTNKIGKFPYSSDQAIIDAILQVRKFCRVIN